MLEFIASNPLLAPLPISILIAGTLVLIVIIFWVAPIQKKLAHLQNKISKINSPSGLSTIENKAPTAQGSRFAKIYDQELKTGDASRQAENAAKSETSNTDNLSKKSQSNIDLARQGLERRKRRDEA